jgi:hypothetical protein
MPKYKGLTYNIVKCDKDPFVNGDMGGYQIVTNCKFIPILKFPEIPDTKAIHKVLNEHIKKFPIVQPEAIKITQEDLDDVQIKKII